MSESRLFVGKEVTKVNGLPGPIHSALLLLVVLAVAWTSASTAKPVWAAQERLFFTFVTVN